MPWKAGIGYRVSGIGRRKECTLRYHCVFSPNGHTVRLLSPRAAREKKENHGLSGNYFLSLVYGPDKKCPSVGFGIQDSGIGTGDNAKEETKEMKRKRGIDRPMD